MSVINIFNGSGQHKTFRDAVNESLVALNNTKIEQDGAKVLSDLNFTQEQSDQLATLVATGGGGGGGGDSDPAKVNVLDIVNNLTSTATNVPLSAAMGTSLKSSVDALNAILLSDDTTLDTVQEIIDKLKELELAGSGGADGIGVVDDPSLDTGQKLVDGIKANQDDITALQIFSQSNDVALNTFQELVDLVKTIDAATGGAGGVLQSDDPTLDTLQKIVNYIKATRVIANNLTARMVSNDPALDTFQEFVNYMKATRAIVDGLGGSNDPTLDTQQKIVDYIKVTRGLVNTASTTANTANTTATAADGKATTNTAGLVTVNTRIDNLLVSDLDVDITALADGFGLSWNATSSQWVAGETAGGGATAITPRPTATVLTMAPDINDLQATASYTLPLASSLVADEFLIFQLAESRGSLRPTVTVSDIGTETITSSKGTDTVIEVLGPVYVIMTSDGVSNWTI